jgi:hypothetical protein
LRHASRILALVLASLGAACFAPAPGPAPSTSKPPAPAPPAPPLVHAYEPTPIGAPADPGACRTVLVLGDSLAVETLAVLPGAYERAGFCADVVGGAQNGANTIVPLVDGATMSERLDTLVAAHTPDAVVFSFVGNVTPAEVPDATAAYVSLVDQARAAGLAVFVTTPPVSAFLCDPHNPWSRGHEVFRRWVLDELPKLRGAEYTTVAWSQVLSPGGDWSGYTGKLRFLDGVVHPVRFADCVHLSGTRGVDVAAHEIVAATQRLWVA